MAGKFNPREFGIEPYFPHRRMVSGTHDISYVSVGKDARVPSTRIMLRGADIDTVADILGERCDVGIGGDCIYLYPGDSHKIARLPNANGRRICCAGLKDWVIEHWGDYADSFSITVEPFHSGRTIRISVKED